MKQLLRDPVKQEYASKLTLIGIFLSIFAAFISRMSVWRRGREEFNLRPFDLVLLSFATLRLGRMVAYDHVSEPLRQPFAETVPDPTGAGETVTARGEGAKRTLGQLLSCPICAGTWISAGLVYGLHALPNATRVFLSIMATVGVAEWLNALTELFSWTAQLARKWAGNPEDRPLRTELFHSGGNYYVRHDHEEYYR